MLMVPNDSRSAQKSIIMKKKEIAKNNVTKLQLVDYWCWWRGRVLNFCSSQVDCFFIWYCFEICPLELRKNKKWLPWWLVPPVSEMKQLYRCPWYDWLNDQSVSSRLMSVKPDSSAQMICIVLNAIISGSLYYSTGKINIILGQEQANVRESEDIPQDLVLIILLLLLLGPSFSRLIPSSIPSVPYNRQYKLFLAAKCPLCYLYWYFVLAFVVVRRLMNSNNKFDKHSESTYSPSLLFSLLLPS